MDIQIPESGNLLDFLLNADEVHQLTSPVLPDATQAQLLQVLGVMDRGELEYVILSDGSKFLQAAGDARSGYTLEYNEGSDKEQYRASQKRIPSATVAEAFVAYLNHDPAWRTQFTWDKFKL